ncbi:MAG TPA: DUF192 domain-containing protein [Thermomicrobiales bacterium]|nr:DUF192 domain-containing protein [Thermomicrobiales bacterium]
MWGPAAFTGDLAETYEDAPGGSRRVRYYDKSRMEDNAWREPDAPWHVTNGLLVVELMRGRLQTGDDDFQPRRPSLANIAGDPDDPAAPVYATLALVAGASPLDDGAPVVQTLARNGAVGASQSAAAWGVTAGPLSPETGHRVASVFWEFMNASGPVSVDGGLVSAPLFENPYYATGLPITEAYWTTVRVGGEPREVLAQAFERRVLTYTPGNPDGWQVEAGNVGQHYHAWRYDNPDFAQVTVTGSDGAQQLFVEVADTQPLRQCGLMHRYSMLEHQAMLFVFAADATGGFWNRNTEIPLQLAWIAADGTLLGLSNMLAADRESASYPVVYPPPGPYRYVIEANAGWFTANGFGAGDTVDLSAAIAHGSQGAVPICAALGYEERAS